MRQPPRPFCAEVSAESSEPLAGTASRVDHWLLLEYRGVWGRQVLGASTLSDAVKRHLGEQLGLLPRSRLLFIRRPERRGHGELRCYFGRSLEHEQRLSKRFDLLNLGTVPLTIILLHLLSN